MKIEIRKMVFFDWAGSCPVCHHGYDVPWESCDTWAEAMAQAATHIAQHRVTGHRLEWAWVDPRQT